MNREPITIQVAPDVARAYKAADDEKREELDAMLEGKLRAATCPPPYKQLPDWCNVYADLTDEEIDEIESAIVRDPSTRTVK